MRNVSDKSCTENQNISHEGKLSEFTGVRNGVRQGCILSPTLFLLILDRIMKRMKGLRKREIQWSMKKRLKDLDYADDICLLVQRFCDMDEKLKRLKEEAGSVEITNKMQHCNRIYYSTVHLRLNMFQAAYCSSSGALTVFAASGLHTHVVTGRSQV
jgi:hypothetical protein